MHPLARRLLRCPEIRLGQQAWPVLFTHGVLLDIEALTGLDVLNGGLNPLQPRAGDLRDMVFVLLQHAGASVTRAEVGAMCGLARLQEFRWRVMEAWRASVPDPAAAGDQAKVSAPQDWMEAWAIADQDLRLTPEAWLGMTPRMLHALAERRLETLRQHELMLSRIAAATANFGARGPSTPLPDDGFMLHPWPPKDKPDEAGVTGEEMMRVFAGMKGLRERRG